MWSETYKRTTPSLFLFLLYLFEAIHPKPSDQRAEDVSGSTQPIRGFILLLLGRGKKWKVDEGASRAESDTIRRGRGRAGVPSPGLRAGSRAAAGGGFK